MTATNDEFKKFHLWSIRFSHYVEKARWTLDYYEVPYTETPMMPIIHWYFTPFVLGVKGKSDNHSTRFSTPILKDEFGKVHSDSSRIMKYLSDRFSSPGFDLFPSDEVTTLDSHYSKYLGPHTRRLFYFNVLNTQQAIFDLADLNVSPLQAKVFKLLFPLCKSSIVAGLGLSTTQVKKGIDHIYKEFEKVDRRLRDGRPFLTGDQFTAADISFACLGGAIVLPQPSEGYGGRLPDYDCGCEQLVKISKEFRNTDVGRWVLKLFKEKRGKRIIQCMPELS